MEIFQLLFFCVFFRNTSWEHLSIFRLFFYCFFPFFWFFICLFGGKNAKIEHGRWARKMRPTHPQNLACFLSTRYSFFQSRQNARNAQNRLRECQAVRQGRATLFAAAPAAAAADAVECYCCCCGDHVMHARSFSFGIEPRRVSFEWRNYLK